MNVHDPWKEKIEMISHDQSEATKSDVRERLKFLIDIHIFLLKYYIKYFIIMVI